MAYTKRHHWKCGKTHVARNQTIPWPSYKRYVWMPLYHPTGMKAQVVSPGSAIDPYRITAPTRTSTRVARFIVYLFISHWLLFIYLFIYLFSYFIVYLFAIIFECLLHKSLQQNSPKFSTYIIFELEKVYWEETAVNKNVFNVFKKFFVLVVCLMSTGNLSGVW